MYDPGGGPPNLVPQQPDNLTSRCLTTLKDSHSQHPSAHHPQQSQPHLPQNFQDPSSLFSRTSFPNNQLCKLFNNQDQLPSKCNNQDQLFKLFNSLN